MAQWSGKSHLGDHDRAVASDTAYPPLPCPSQLLMALQKDIFQKYTFEYLK